MTPYFDLDGVLAGFVPGAIRHYAPSRTVPEDMSDVRWGIEEQFGFGADPEEFWRPLGHDFWAGLPRHEDGFALFRAVMYDLAPARPVILSTPHNVLGCRDGKYEWVRTHLYEYRDSLFLGRNKSELAHPGALLIDDHDDNVDKWTAAGGGAVLVPRPWNRRSHECHAGGHFNVPAVHKEVMAAIRGR